MEGKFNFYEVEFDFNFLDEVDKILPNNLIIQKSFHQKITYLIKLSEENEERVIYALLKVTYNLIKITRLTPPSDDTYEVGTDKPLGSKAAIDEN